MESISLARGVPATECLALEELADCARAAIERDGATVLNYGPAGGYGPLREWIADRHRVEPERVVLTNGSLQGFRFLAELLAPNGTVIVEAPTYDRPLKILDDLGAEVICVPLDEEPAIEDGAFLYTIPTFQNPTGSTLSADRRGRLAELVRSRRLPVLEDDPYGLVRFEGDPLPSVFELEGGVDVMYSSSFSKTIAPGLRVGYAIVPEALASELEDLVASTYITPALLSQATVYQFLRRGLFEPNLERVRGLLRARRDAMLEALDRELEGRARWNRPEGGYFLWLELPEGADAAELLTRATEGGVTFVPGVDFGGQPNSMRLAFSFVSPAEIDEGVRRLARLLAATPAAV